MIDWEDWSILLNQYGTLYFEVMFNGGITERFEISLNDFESQISTAEVLKKKVRHRISENSLSLDENHSVSVGIIRQVA